MVDVLNKCKVPIYKFYRPLFHEVCTEMEYKPFFMLIVKPEIVSEECRNMLGVHNYSCHFCFYLFYYRLAQKNIARKANLSVRKVKKCNNKKRTNHIPASTLTITMKQIEKWDELFHMERNMQILIYIFSFLNNRFFIIFFT